MKSLLVVFTLCGSPQHVLIHEKDSTMFVPFNAMTRFVPINEYIKILRSPQYEKRLVKLEELTGHICA